MNRRNEPMSCTGEFFRGAGNQMHIIFHTQVGYSPKPLSELDLLQRIGDQSDPRRSVYEHALRRLQKEKMSHNLPLDCPVYE